jgi:hypothetical protein
LSVLALANLDRIRARARKIVEADRALLAAFLDREPGVAAPRTAWGTTCFARLKQGSVDEFLGRLRGEFETTCVPGSFFEMLNHFRIGMGVNTEVFGEGLQRISRCLKPQSVPASQPPASV